MTDSIAHRVASRGFEDEAEDPPITPLTRAEARDLRVRSPQVSPWRVIAAQVVVGCLSAALLGLFLDHPQVIGSALYGAATVVVPAALMARGMTSSLSSMSPGSGAVSFVLWEFVKIAVTVLMLMLAPKIVQPLYWPALLVSLVLCLQVYWVALSWRGRSKA